MADCFSITKNGNKIELLGNTNNANVLVIGVFHGDEPQGDYLIKKYCSSVLNTKIMFIPCLNPDGMINKTRCNANGVDLNRNFSTKNWKKTERNVYFGGEYPDSEIETRFLEEVVEKYKPKYILSLHAPYKIVNYDGNGLDLAKKIANVIGYPVESDIGYPTPGSFGNWAGVERNIPTITLELDEEVDVNELEKPVFDIFKILEEY